MSEAIFINCIADDRPLAEALAGELARAGLACCLPPSELTVQANNAMVATIRRIAEQNGILIALLSPAAEQDAVFLSNLQLMSEAAHTRQALLIVRIGVQHQERALQLFYSQALVLRVGQNPQQHLARIVHHAQQLLGQATAPQPQRRLNPLLGWLLALLVILLSLVAAAQYTRPRSPTTQPTVTATPVLLYIPFGEQTNDMGLEVDVRSLPPDPPPTDAAQAAFAFSSPVLLELQDFSNPAMDGSYDGSAWNINYDSFADIERFAVLQSDGVLRVAIAPQAQQSDFTLFSRYGFSLQQLNYIGMRVRILPYTGQRYESTAIGWSLGLNSSGGFTSLAYFDMLRKPLSEGWHTLELRRSASADEVTLYLDGSPLGSTALKNPLDAQRLLQLTLSVRTFNTTDWVELQLDEVRFGADAPLPQAQDPQQAVTRFQPQVTLWEETFADVDLLPARLQGPDGTFSFADGRLRFEIAPKTGAEMVVPGRTLKEANYWAVRYRLTNPTADPWEVWSSLSLSLRNANDPFSLTFNLPRDGYNFAGWSGPNTGLSINALSPLARQPELWHTMEVFVQPLGSGEALFQVQYWWDGILIGIERIQQAELFVDANAPLELVLHFSTDSSTQPLRGEIDNWLIGQLQP